MPSARANAHRPELGHCEQPRPGDAPLTDPQNFLAAVIHGLDPVALSDLLDRHFAVRGADTGAGGETDHPGGLVEQAIDMGRLQTCSHHPQIRARRWHPVDEHQKRHLRTRRLDQRDRIAHPPVGHLEAHVQRLGFDLDLLRFTAGIDRSAQKLMHGVCRASSQVRLAAGMFQKQNLGRAVDPYRLAVPAPSGSDAQRGLRRGLLTVHFRLCPCDDKRASIARSHACMPAVLFLLRTG